MANYKGEYISKDASKLEAQIKEKYGKKRGAAMIIDARQCVDYELDSNYSQMDYMRKYLEKLKSKL